MAQQECN